MAFIGIHLQLLLQMRDKLRTARGGEPLKLLSLGYPDALMSDDVLQQLLKEDVSALPKQKDAEKILTWFGMQGRLPYLRETDGLLKHIGLQPTYLDISPSRGIELQQDLNAPLPKELHEAFDVVLDLGTSEHCYNVGQTMMSIAGALRHGGVVLHSTPFSYFEHGFFNFSPCFYTDFYQQNGFAVHFMKGLVGTPLDYRLFDIDMRWRQQPMPPNSILLVIAERATVQPLKWPMQAKYLANPTLMG